MTACGIHRRNDAAFTITFYFNLSWRHPLFTTFVIGVVERICQYHALTQEFFERFITLHITRVTQQFVEEA
ncbi:Uncharacterised protein [Vibrio cholerae]|uniref:Uncharacterized protein n=1 Tax=Vibrio cholerae TaxID=666 RepID=A0A656AVP3_VIBCL|nr:Uncharacterised protein [Vibrio cholerae]CSC65778.1 Uncharacterised protein [Vibrio cholerae]CSD41872.1 Uncharacterised protein [Vibrio cholerae]